MSLRLKHLVKLAAEKEQKRRRKEIAGTAAAIAGLVGAPAAGAIGTNLLARKGIESQVESLLDAATAKNISFEDLATAARKLSPDFTPPELSTFVTVRPKDVSDTPKDAISRMVGAGTTRFVRLRDENLFRRLSMPLRHSFYERLIKKKFPKEQVGELNEHLTDIFESLDYSVRTALTPSIHAPSIITAEGQKKDFSPALAREIARSSSPLANTLSALGAVGAVAALPAAAFLAGRPYGKKKQKAEEYLTAAKFLLPSRDKEEREAGREFLEKAKAHLEGLPEERSKALKRTLLAQAPIIAGGTASWLTPELMALKKGKKIFETALQNLNPGESDVATLQQAWKKMARGSIMSRLAPAATVGGIAIGSTFLTDLIRRASERKMLKEIEELEGRKSR